MLDLVNVRSIIRKAIEKKYNIWYMYIQTMISSCFTLGLRDNLNLFDTYVHAIYVNSQSGAAMPLTRHVYE